MEYELLKHLVTHPGRAFTREALLGSVWGYEFFGGARTVDVHVRRVRVKLGTATPRACARCVVSGTAGSPDRGAAVGREPGVIVTAGDERLSCAVQGNDSVPFSGEHGDCRLDRP